MRNEQLLIELTQSFGVAGHEKSVRQLITEHIKAYADEYFTDAVGNLIVFKKGKGGEKLKKLMFAAHMDEIGFMVKKIEADGRLRVCNMGWNWVASAYNGRVRFQNGVSGVVGCMGSVEDAKNDVGKLYIDIGATDKADAEKYVKIGDVCGYYGEYINLQNDIICTKTLDDRLGCYQLIEALKLNDGTFPNDVYYVFTVQEEVGCRGSKVSAARINPDFGFAVDITPAHDYPCDLEGSNTVGGGIAIKYSDPSVICDEDVVNAMVSCCEKNNIPYQPDVIDKGGTDASSMNMSNFGVRVGGISVAVRYAHSQSSVASKKDIEAGVDLIDALSRDTLDF